MVMISPHWADSSSHDVSQMHTALSWIASSIAAERRIAALVERHAPAGLDAAVDAAISYTRRRFPI